MKTSIARVQEIKKSTQQQKRIDALEIKLNQIIDAAAALSWIGEELSKSGDAMYQGTLIRRTANFIADEGEDVFSDLKYIVGGAA